MVREDTHVWHIVWVGLVQNWSVADGGDTTLKQFAGPAVAQTPVQ